MAYDTYQSRRKMDYSRESLININRALLEYRDTHGAYPRPARLDIPIDDMNYGWEYDISSINPATGTCEQGICRVSGRDVNGDGHHETILIGEIPINTINESNEIDLIKISDAYDAWEHKITYAVTEILTDPTTFGSFKGAIYVEDENGLSVLNEPGIAHFVLISHGMNGKGSYDKNGNKIPCATGLTTDPDGNPLPPTPPMSMLEADLQNCVHNNGVFVNGLYSLADNNKYFDDYVHVQAWASRRIWAINSDGSIYNTNIGNVGVNTHIPEQRLHVNGDIQAFTFYADPFNGASITDNFYCDADNDGIKDGDCGLCDSLGKNCMPPTILGGEMDRMKCPAGYAITKIENNQVYCDSVTVIPAASSCPKGIQAIKGDGTLVCVP